MPQGREKQEGIISANNRDRVENASAEFYQGFSLKATETFPCLLEMTSKKLNDKKQKFSDKNGLRFDSFPPFLAATMIP